MFGDPVEEDKLVIWWSPDLTKEDVFVLPIVTLEEGIKTLGTLSSYDEFMISQEEIPEGVESRKSEGAIAFLTPAGELEAWSYVSIMDGGKKYTDPMEYLTDKYSKQEIIT